MKACPYCHQPLPEHADECPECGTEIGELPLPDSELELALLTDRLADLALRKPLLISPTIPVREVIRLLALNRVGCVLIVHDEKLCGIFTERDALMRINDRLTEIGDRPISEFMTKAVHSLPATAKVVFAVHQMDLGGYRHVPIVDEQGRPVGVFTVRDMLDYLQRKIGTE